ncbi:TetR/AcrR family transcriptional regulator [Roseiarcus sp.]|jgi:AcrR family transcriptional regulator|uniref:TetR/AcrR family transcriptional regulator n=1 Tax=Roseiarcus sp. TaxID=1969460 RepID=UPI003D0BC73D
MSIEILPTAKEPKRERGKQRVAALIDAGAELFAEKGYEATTMTEIAQRAGAAIGSLYQFFPSKEALAEALFNRYAERAAASFARVEELAPGRPARELADLLIDYKLALRTDRDATIALSSSVAGIVERRKPLGDALRGRIASILRAANRALSEDEAAAAAVIVSQVMKIVPALAATENERPLPLIGETRKLLALYIGEVLRT